MPVRASLGAGQTVLLWPTEQWQTLMLTSPARGEFQVDANFYVTARAAPPPGRSVACALASVPKPPRRTLSVAIILPNIQDNAWRAGKGVSQRGGCGTRCVRGRSLRRRRGRGLWKRRIRYWTAVMARS
jgi:hypothetical protein